MRNKNAFAPMWIVLLALGGFGITGQLFAAEADIAPAPSRLGLLNLIEDILVPEPPLPRTETLTVIRTETGFGTGGTEEDAVNAAEEEALDSAFEKALADAFAAGYEVVDLQVEVFECDFDETADTNAIGAPNRWISFFYGTIRITLTAVCEVEDEAEDEDEPLFSKLLLLLDMIWGD